MGLLSIRKANPDLKLITRNLIIQSILKSKILITGAAGFIGMHLVFRLITEEHTIIGLDNLNDYYDPVLKKARLSELGIRVPEEAGEAISDKYPNFSFIKADITDKEELLKIFRQSNFDYVIHLAAQAGVRYSLSNPASYIENNLVGFFNLLEACKAFPVRHLLFASSSSVYGMNQKIPFSTKDKVDRPVSLYAATKKSNELMAYTYSHLYHIPVTGLRFFTVYGPWYRPDMAMFLFADAIFAGRPIKVFNNGEMKRDFTYIDDITEAVKRLIYKIPGENEKHVDEQNSCYRLLNIGNHTPVKLLDMITLLEENLGRKAAKEFLPMQPGDVPVTYADIDELNQLTGFKPQTNLTEGIAAFARWYKSYFKLD